MDHRRESGTAADRKTSTSTMDRPFAQRWEIAGRIVQKVPKAGEFVDALTPALQQLADGKMRQVILTPNVRNGELVSITVENLDLADAP